MAKQVGPLFVTGTIDGIIFYKLGDQYYLRSKGDYKSGKQMRKDPKLKRTMEKADQFRTAVKLLKPLYYRHLPKPVRKYGLFGKLTGIVNTWLQEGKGKEEVIELLIAHLHNLLPATVVPATTMTEKATETAPSLKGTIPKGQLLEAPPAVKEMKVEVSKPPECVKQARYLSRWKVKRNGRLHIPKRNEAVKLRSTSIQRE